MKSFILAALLIVVALPLRAQITLEHIYPPSTIVMGLGQVDSGEWKYISYSYADSVPVLQISNLDHSLDKQVRIYKSVPPKSRGIGPVLIAKHLFDTSGKYTYLYVSQYVAINGAFQFAIRIVREDSTVLFSCDSCDFYDRGATNGASFLHPSGLFSTDSGVKMMIDNEIENGKHTTSIYSIPGHLPGSSQMLTVGGDPSNPNYMLASPAAYPNPSQGRVRIAYDLPSSITSGEIVLTTSDGREVKRYSITNAFSDLLIEEGDLPAGSYFYKVVTARGESPVQRIVREK